MGSLNFNPFGGNWFRKPEKRLQAFNPNHFPDSLNPFKPQKHQAPLFASISSSAPPFPSGDEKPANKYTEMLEQYFHEEANRPDFRSDPVIDQIVKEDPIFDKGKERTREEIEENEKWWDQFRSNPIMEFLTHAQEYGEKLHELEMKSNNKPYHKEDKEIWDALPNVKGLDGRPMPRYALNGESANEKFWDFARQFFFGLWGYQQRPYPPGRPIDVAQAIGYQNLEKRYYDCKLVFRLVL